MTTWGPMTIERHTDLKRQGVHLRVFVRGEDVTDRCRFANDTPGHEVAELYRRIGAGFQFHLDEDGEPVVEVAREQIELRVVIERWRGEP